jgi:hypothetical protein
MAPRNLPASRSASAPPAAIPPAAFPLPANPATPSHALSQAAAAGYQRNWNLSPRLAVSRWIEAQTGWPVRKLAKTPAYRTTELQSGRQTITAAGPLPDDLRRVLETINRDN